MASPVHSVHVGSHRTPSDGVHETNAVVRRSNNAVGSLYGHHSNALWFTTTPQELRSCCASWWRLHGDCSAYLRCHCDVSTVLIRRLRSVIYFTDFTELPWLSLLFKGASTTFLGACVTKTNPESVILSGVGDPFLGQKSRYHRFKTHKMQIFSA